MAKSKAWSRRRQEGQCAWGRLVKDKGLEGEEAASSCFARDVSASIGAPNLILCAVGNLLELCREVRGSDQQSKKIMQAAPRRIFLLRRRRLESSCWALGSTTGAVGG